MSHADPIIVEIDYETRIGNADVLILAEFEVSVAIESSAFDHAFGTSPIEFYESKGSIVEPRAYTAFICDAFGNDIGAIQDFQPEDGLLKTLEKLAVDQAMKDLIKNGN